MKRTGKFLGIIILVLLTGALFAIAQEKPQADLGFTQLSGEWKGRMGLGTVDLWLKINALPSGQIEGKYVQGSREFDISGSVKKEGDQLVAKISILGSRSFTNPEFRLILERRGSEDVLSGGLFIEGQYYNATFYRSVPKPTTSR